jgi:hypothetical protein
VTSVIRKKFGNYCRIGFTEAMLIAFTDCSNFEV